MANLLHLGVVLILVAVGYQYRNEISLLVEEYISKGSVYMKWGSMDRGSPQPKAVQKSKTTSTPGNRGEEESLATESSPQATPKDEYYNPPFDMTDYKELYSESGTRLVTINELAAHGPNGPLKPIWLAMLGRVYDVDKGVDYYGPEGGYNFFAGRDGSRAFVTGEFNDEGLTDDLEGFSPLQIGEIDGWVKFYDKEYTYVGKLIGRYYNKDGGPTKEWYKVQKLLGQKEKMEAERKELEKRFPGCNSHWTKQEGGTVFCSEKSGGVHRDWVGYPRRYFAPGSKSWRCSCVREEDLDSPHVKLYPDCDPTSIRCKVDPNKLKKLRE